MENIKKKILKIIPDIKNTLLGLYNSLPLSPIEKQKLKNVFFPCFGFLFKNSLRYRYWQISVKHQDSDNKISQLVNFFAYGQPGSIAVHLHLFYIDLLDEFVLYLSKIPFSYDLYVSITDEKHSNLIEKKIASIKKIGKTTIKTVKNRGRDVAPMVVTFAKDLLSYDYVCHIHTKKSKHAGFEQKNWRQHLLYNLLGNEKIVRSIFTIFDKHSDIGIIYPETYHNIPYWTQTWLANKNEARKLLDKLQIDPNLPDYVDYPAGTMFWARSEAIRPLLELGLEYKDFVEEKGQIDGTLAHAIEHSLIVIAQNNGMHLCEVNFEMDFYRLYLGSRNLWQYWVKNSERLKAVIDSVDFVSFDILDTIVSLKFLENTHHFDIIALRIRKELGFEFDFVKIRKEAEKRAWRAGGVYTIDGIYECFHSLTSLEQEEIHSIKKIEKLEAIRASVVRREILETYNYALSAGRKIIIISDIDYNREDIESMLAGKGFSGDHIILSSYDLNMKKQSGEIWDYYEDRFKNQKGIHIGHDEHADVQMLADRNIPFFHIMSCRNIFFNTGLGHLFHKRFHGRVQTGDSLIIGNIITRVFNSPFCLSEDDGLFKIKDMRILAYMVLGPIIFCFILWLLRKKTEKGIERLIFQNDECFGKNLLDRVMNKINGGKSGICLGPEKKDEKGIVLISDGLNGCEHSLSKDYLFFFSPKAYEPVLASSKSFFLNRAVSERHSDLLFALLFRKAPDFMENLEKSKDVILQAKEGVNAFFDDILYGYSDLIMDIPFSEDLKDFFLDVLDSDIVCV